MVADRALRDLRPQDAGPDRGGGPGQGARLEPVGEDGALSAAALRRSDVPARLLAPGGRTRRHLRLAVARRNAGQGGGLENAQRGLFGRFDRQGHLSPVRKGDDDQAGATVGVERVLVRRRVRQGGTVRRGGEKRSPGGVALSGAGASRRGSKRQALLCKTRIGDVGSGGRTPPARDCVQPMSRSAGSPEHRSAGPPPAMSDATAVKIRRTLLRKSRKRTWRKTHRGRDQTVGSGCKATVRFAAESGQPAWMARQAGQVDSSEASSLRRGKQTVRLVSDSGDHFIFQAGFHTGREHGDEKRQGEQERVQQSPLEEGARGTENAVEVV